MAAFACGTTDLAPVGNVSNPPLCALSKLLRFNVLSSVNDAQNGDSVFIGAEIYATFAIGKSLQAWTDPVARNAGEVSVGNPLNFGC